MKKLILCSFLSISISSPVWAATLIDAWDFAGLTATTASTTTPDTISATIGTGVINISTFGFGSPQGTNPERTAFAGSTLNAFAGGDVTAGNALALANSTANGKSVLFTFSMSGYENLVVSFATRGTATGFDTGTWAWSTDNSTYTTLTGVNTASRSTTFAIASADFSSALGLNDAPVAYLTYTLSGATSGAGNNRLDNIQFNAALIPEPTSLSLLGGFGLLAWFVSRRRS